MKSAIRNPKSAIPSASFRWGLLPLSMCVASLPCGAWQVATNLTLKADLSLKEGYDSNVYLQDHEPDLTAVPQAVRPFQESFITSVTPRLAFDWKPCPAFTAMLSYAPEMAFYHSESSEDYVAHRGVVHLGGKVGEVPWELPNSITFIDGSREGLYYGVSTVPNTLDGVPAIGGIPVRDRREQFIYRGGFKATWSSGKFFLRPVLAAYLHDFQTVQKLNGKDPNGNPYPDYGYENYVDRNAMDFGVDVGWSVTPQTKLYLGYRYGYETEGEMVGSAYHYNAEINRPLAGVEGKPAKWLTANFSIGPDIHHTVSHHDPRFEPDYTTLWVDGVVTFLPTAKDSVALTWKQNTQPAFSSPSVYQDTIYDGLVRHRFDNHWSVSGGFRGYQGDWRSPVKRLDWIYTVSASVAYTLDTHFSADLSYSYDWVDSAVPNTEGREFTRHLGWLALKYSF
jgi:hypothetical protein